MKIVFTSCMDAVRVPDQPIWEQIERQNPDVLALLGDQIYMDWGDLGESNWRQEIGDGASPREKALEAFVTEMHMRYEAQWQVVEFRRLLQRVHNKSGAGGLLITWDDHDFAWNNSLGGGVKADKHFVRPEVKAVAMRLFLQFKDKLQNGPYDETYPSLGDWRQWSLVPPGRGVEQMGELAIAGRRWPFALLDNRWYRTHTLFDPVLPRAGQSPLASCTLLGAEQRARLKSRLDDAGSGLLIVLGGVPPKHDYRFSEQGWANQHAGDFPEYAELVAAKRPVLFLAGDIHANEWGGRLPGVAVAGLVGAAPTPSEVIQISSSGAAVKGTGPFTILPQFSVVEVEGQPIAGTVRVVFYAQTKASLWALSSGPLTLEFDKVKWKVKDADGAAVAANPWTAPDDQPLSVLTLHDEVKNPALPWGPIPGTGSKTIKVLSDEALDTVFSDGFERIADVATATVVSAARGPVFDILIKETDGNKKSNAVDELVHETFERASAAGKAQNKKKTVVLFIHGFAKPYAAAVMGGYEMRARFPDCEPLVFSWPSGRTGGILQSLFGYSGVSKAAVKSNLGLSGALVSLGRYAKRYATKVNDNEKVSCIILARSMGTLALANAIAGVPGADYNGHLASVKRIVLSSPALQDNNKLLSFKWLSSLTCQKVITVNQHDQTLRFANWLDGTGQPMGIAPPSSINDPTALYIDFTESGGVGRLHDYLFPRINPRVVQVNDALMSSELLLPFNLSAAMTEVAPQIFRVN